MQIISMKMMTINFMILQFSQWLLRALERQSWQGLFRIGAVRFSSFEHGNSFLRNCQVNYVMYTLSTKCRPDKRILNEKQRKTAIILIWSLKEKCWMLGLSDDFLLFHFHLSWEPGYHDITTIAWKWTLLSCYQNCWSCFPRYFQRGALLWHQLINR